MTDTAITQNELATILDRYDEVLNSRFKALEDQLELQEKIIAGLVQGYSELAAVTDSLMTVLVNETPEQREVFMATLAASRQAMLNLFMEANANNQATTDKFIATEQSSR